MNLTDLVAQIEIETKLNPHWDDPEYLSSLLLRLASYYATLGRFVADAERDTGLAEIQYKFAREAETKDKIEGGMAIGAAEHMGEVAAHEDRIEHVAIKHKARLLFISRQSLEATMDAIRSRLSYIKTEREASRHAV